METSNGGNILKWARILTTPLQLLEKPTTEGLLMSGRPVTMEAEVAALRLVVAKLVRALARLTEQQQQQPLCCPLRLRGSGRRPRRTPRMKLSCSRRVRAAVPAPRAPATLSCARWCDPGAETTAAMAMAVSFRRESKLLANELLVYYGQRKRSVMLQQRDRAARCNQTSS